MKERKLRLARVSAVTTRGDEILIPCYPLLRQEITPQGARLEFISKKAQEHSLMTIAHDLMKKGVELEEMKRISMIPNNWTAEQIEKYISENGKMEFNEK